MLSDKEILVQGLEKYATNIASRLFGLSSIPFKHLLSMQYVICMISMGK